MTAQRERIIGRDYIDIWLKKAVVALEQGNIGRAHDSLGYALKLLKQDFSPVANPPS